MHKTELTGSLNSSLLETEAWLKAVFLNDLKVLLFNLQSNVEKLKKEKDTVKRSLDTTTRELHESRNTVARLDGILKDHECKLSEKEEGSKQVEASLLKLQLENEEIQRRLVELNTELSEKTKVNEDSLSQVLNILHYKNQVI